MFERVIKLIREEKVSLFIGAGFSYEAQAPSVRMLCDAILSQFDNDQQREEHKNEYLPDIANFYVEDICSGSRNSLIDLLQKQFAFTPAKMDDHQVLAKIPHFHNIFTTNYDTLLEDSFESSDCQVIRKDADCAYIDEAKPVRVFKIHGDFVNQDFVVITSNDYKEFFNNRTNPQMWDVVKHDFLTKHILFIGYSLEDDNILQLIRTLSDCVGRNQKQMFLIAPKLGKIKEGKLKAMKVKYYDAVASDFLAELTKELDANIGMDFRHHKVSPETFNRYCNLHGFTPEMALKQKEDNDIVNFKPLQGKRIEHKVNFTVKNQPIDMVQHFDFEKYGSFIKDGNLPFHDVPYIRFHGDDITDGTHMVNGIVMTRGFREILVAPVIKNIDLTIKIPGRNFMEKVKAQSYRLNDTKFVVQFDCHIYTVKIVFTYSNDTTKGLRFSFTFEEKDTYTDNSLAIKWIDFICAFFNKEDFYIMEISSSPFNVGTEYSEEIKHNFNDYKKYYEFIKYIEMNGNVTFQTYNKCTERNLTVAYYIASFLAHKPINCACKGGMEFSTKELICDKEFVERAESKLPVSIVSTDIEEKRYTLNGHTFVIPYTHNVYSPCKVVKIKKGKKGYMAADLKYDGDSYQIYFSTQSASEFFPDVKEFKEAK